MSSHTPDSMLDLIIKDLRPTPGRFRQALRITLATLITLFGVMAFRLPAAVIALYFVLVISRDTPLQSLRWTLTIAATVCASLALACLVVTLSANDPVIRLGSVPVVIFVAAILVYAAKNPAVGSIGGYLYCIFISFWEDNTSPAHILNRSALTLLALISALLIATLIEFLFRYRKPRQRLIEQERQRLEAVLSLYEGFALHLPQADLLPIVQRCEMLASGGQMEMQHLLHHASRHADPAGERAPFDAVYIAMLSELLDLTTAFGKRRIDNLSLNLAATCQSMAVACIQLMRGETSAFEQDEHGDLADAGQIQLLLRQMVRERVVARTDDRTYLVLEARDNSPFLPSSAWQDKAALGFACKVSLCATICYVFYHAVAWSEISSCVTTVLITALATTGSMKQRLFFRCAGVVFGGLILGMGAIVFLFPNMDSIAGLMILVSGVAFVAAWIGYGRTLGYLGLQLGFCFYTVVFRGFAPETQVQSARDALLGIAVATAVMWLVFDQIWPVRTTVAIRLRLANLVTMVANVFEQAKTGGSDKSLLDNMRVTRYRSGQDLAIIRTLNEMTYFDFGASREDVLRKANALQSLALEVSGMVWDQLSLTYTQASSNRECHDLRRYMNTRLPVLLNLQSLLREPVWDSEFGSGRFNELKTEKRNAERALNALADFRAP